MTADQITKVRCRCEGGPFNGREFGDCAPAYPTIAPHGSHSLNRRRFLTDDGVFIHPERDAIYYEYHRVGPREIQHPNAVTIFRFVRVMTWVAISAYYAQREKRRHRA